MSPASSDSTALCTPKGLRGCMNSSRIAGLVMRKMNHENSRGPLRITASNRRRAAGSAAGCSKKAFTTSAPSKALVIARCTPDENTGSMKA